MQYRQTVNENEERSNSKLHLQTAPTFLVLCSFALTLDPASSNTSHPSAHPDWAQKCRGVKPSCAPAMQSALDKNEKGGNKGKDRDTQSTLHVVWICSMERAFTHLPRGLQTDSTPKKKRTIATVRGTRASHQKKERKKRKLALLEVLVAIAEFCTSVQDMNENKQVVAGSQEDKTYAQTTWYLSEGNTLQTSCQASET